MYPNQFGRYEIEAEIGSGAMAHVYRALDPLCQRTVAIKAIKPQYLTRDPSQEYTKRFRREAQAVGRLTHPNIIPIYDVGDNYFVMEYIQGITLQDFLSERTNLTPMEVLLIISPIADALDFAHRRGIIHRDIKPSNIIKSEFNLLI